MRWSPLILLALLASPSLLEAQVISGVLLEADSEAPLSAGIVKLLDQSSVEVAQLRTDSAGAFAFILPRRGAYRLRAEYPGLRTTTSPALSVSPPDTVEVEFSLGRDIVVLEPLVVKARSRRVTPAARRFYDRAGSGIFGNFITRSDIDKIRPIRTTELLRRIPGIQVTPIMGGNDVSVRGTCRPTVHVDGVRVNGYRSIDDLVQPLDVEGMEVYRSSSQAPAEYTGLLAGCAVILIWTRIE